jgi:hypothetical protein
MYKIEFNRLNLSKFTDSGTHTLQGVSTRITNTLTTQDLSSECPPRHDTNTFTFSCLFLCTWGLKNISVVNSWLQYYYSYTLQYRTKPYTTSYNVTSWFPWCRITKPGVTLVQPSLQRWKLSSSYNKKKYKVWNIVLFFLSRVKSPGYNMSRSTHRNTYPDDITKCPHKYLNYRCPSVTLHD